MVKSDLLFDWDTRDFSRGRKMASWIVVALIFTAVFGFVRVSLRLPAEAGRKSAVILKVPDDDFGRIWQMKAVEEGPFPGGLDSEISITSEMESERLFPLSDVRWGNYRPKLRPFSETKIELQKGLAQKGKQYFPERSNSVEPLISQKDPSTPTFASVPLLIPFNTEARKWIPDQLPELDVEISPTDNTSLWRFLIKLDSSGRVEHCLSLGEERSEATSAMVRWLSTVQFEASMEAGRWFGLRVEFQTKRSDAD